MRFILAPVLCLLMLTSELILVGLIDLSFAVVKFYSFIKGLKAAAKHLI